MITYTVLFEDRYEVRVRMSESGPLASLIASELAGRSYTCYVESEVCEIRLYLPDGGPCYLNRYGQ